MANIRIYSTPTCPYCRKTKEFLKQNNIQFTDIDVSADKTAAEEMVKKSGQMGVPVLDIDGAIIIGADMQAIKKALNLQ
jgi:glutaredoxin-like YruB-family protein